MNDWRRLIELREQRKRIALEALQVEQRAVERSRMQVQAAQAQWQQKVDAKSGHWTVTRDAMTHGGFNVAQLRDASAWSGALDAQITQQNAVVQQARAAAQQSEQTLAVRQHALRVAAAGVIKAQRMREREVNQLERLSESRSEAMIDDVAAVSWARQNGSSAGRRFER